MISAISPVDGRYSSKCWELQPFFSEFALIKYRVNVEIRYLLALNRLSLKNFESFTEDQRKKILSISETFNEEEAVKVKEIEKKTNHDVKAVEYYIKERLKEMKFNSGIEYVHFGLTSQDVNHTALPLMIGGAMKQVYLPAINDCIQKLKDRTEKWKGIPMLSRTHGQPATPTTVGKEIRVFHDRVIEQVKTLTSLDVKAKFGGASGNLNAHKAAFPDTDWIRFSDNFIGSFGLKRLQTSTQISDYDDYAVLFHNLIRINTILIDFSRDMWTYISMNYFRQKIQKGETGSSTMPHKVNPIDFENAEGNLGIANAMFAHLADKLPVSRMQRDLTDSTVSRNIGVPFAHSLIAIKSVIRGLDKLSLNQAQLKLDLDKNWAVVSEAIQTILRRENYHEPYEALKELTRGKDEIKKEDIVRFIESLNVSKEVKDELKQISPHNYLGYF